MNEFGRLLRFYRERCSDPQLNKNRLTQVRLADLLSQKLGLDPGYTGGAVSEWERGQSKINGGDRRVLLCLLQVLREAGGLWSPPEAESLLYAGNYRGLDEKEHGQVFPDVAIRRPETPRPPDPVGQWRTPVQILKGLFPRRSDELTALLDRSKEGPQPHWARLLLAVLGWPGGHWSIHGAWRAMVWIGVWLLTWRLIFPIMHWPFTHTAEARLAAWFFGAGSLALPPVIGALTRTRDEPFWRQTNLAGAWITRLYTHQGAWLGFQLGGLMLFAAALLGSYVGLRRVPLAVEALAATWPIILGYAAARQVPYNLWRAYGRLRLADGAIFFVCILLGPLAAGLFIQLYPVVLSGPVGIMAIFVAAGIVTGLMAWRQRGTGSSVIPAH